MTGQRNEENKKKNAEVTKLVESIVNQPPRPPQINVPKYVEDLWGKDLQQPGTVSGVHAYEQEISAIGVLLRNLAPLDHETRTRVLSYAMQWVDDQKGGTDAK